MTLQCFAGKADSRFGVLIRDGRAYMAARGYRGVVASMPVNPSIYSDGYWESKPLALGNFKAIDDKGKSPAYFNDHPAKVEGTYFAGVAVSDLVSLSTASSGDENRYFICGVSVSGTGGMIATDGRMMAWKGAEWECEAIYKEKNYASIPKEAIKLIKALKIKEVSILKEDYRYVLEADGLRVTFYDDMDQLPRAHEVIKRREEGFTTSIEFTSNATDLARKIGNSSSSNKFKRFPVIKAGPNESTSDGFPVPGITASERVHFGSKLLAASASFKIFKLESAGPINAFFGVNKETGVQFCAMPCALD